MTTHSKQLAFANLCLNLSLTPYQISELWEFFYPTSSRQNLMKTDECAVPITSAEAQAESPLPRPTGLVQAKTLSVAELTSKLSQVKNLNLLVRQLPEGLLPDWEMRTSIRTLDPCLSLTRGILSSMEIWIEPTSK